MIQQHQLHSIDYFYQCHCIDIMIPILLYQTHHYTHTYKNLFVKHFEIKVAMKPID